MYSKPLCIQSKMAAEPPCAGLTGALSPALGPLAGGHQHHTRRGFYPQRDPLSRTGCARGTHPPQQRSVPRPETPVTKPASAAALAAPCPSLFSDSGSLAQNLVEAFLAVRGETERRAAPLTPEDQLIQSMPDASPAKWHRAHTTWFFEQFLLGGHCDGYRPFHPDYAFLFNSYYVSAGPRHARAERGLLTRPGAEEVTGYRKHVDAAVVKFFHDTDEKTLAGLVPLLEVGFNHEQQHQELMLTDILHAFAQNPIPPAYDPAWTFPASSRSGEEWIELKEGIHTVGHADDSFHFDNEKPAHRALVGPVSIARNLVTNGEWLAFMDDSGYATA